MFLRIVVLIIALVVVIAQHASEEAIRTLKERGGIPYDRRRRRWSRSMGPALLGVAIMQMFVPSSWFDPPPPMVATYGPDSLWMGMNAELIDQIGGEREDLVAYGRELVSNTSRYLGPQGTVAQVTNGMNCQNCHLNAGTKPWGNNYGAVWST